ncbi:redoxin domain-containing protein [Mucilaginibacter arboris]|uniref:Redoxin domain-containing protein n=1 Tax=Mucilaginibacter arboris TaxID=2682090 RepID=A0A7K1T1N1_9SPHI|nr:redoxin domain-containing protein [Mucilaginibacter arboris]MVN23459.1 redoxin domain-containing protein [Mucilaginibacter arboris]
MLQKGTKAPEFELSSGDGENISLQDFKGKNLIMAFYPADWSPVCSDEMALFNEMLKYFSKYEAVLVGVSVDSKWCHQAFSKSRNLHFPLLADFEPKGEISKKYGVYDEKEGTSDRALFVIDKEGVIAWSYLSPVGTNPGADGILEALENLTSKNNYV